MLTQNEKPATLAQKLLARAAGLFHVQPGEIVTCKEDLAILNGVDHHAIYELPTSTDLLAVVLPWHKVHLNSGSDRRSVSILP